MMTTMAIGRIPTEVAGSVVDTAVVAAEDLHLTGDFRQENQSTILVDLPKKTPFSHPMWRQ